MSLDTVLENETKIKNETIKLWCVRILNDDYTPMDFVIEVLVTIFNKSGEDAEQITIDVHQEGSAIIGIYTKDIAETKVKRAMALATKNEHPLRLMAEPS